MCPKVSDTTKIEGDRYDMGWDRVGWDRVGWYGIEWDWMG